MHAFLESLPPGTYVSVDALRAWLSAGKGPSEGGRLIVSAIDSLTDDQYQAWRASLPGVGVEALEREAVAAS